MDYGLPSSSVQAKILEWVAMPSFREGEVIFVFFLQKQYNLLRSKCENITDQTKITDNRNAYVTMN